MPDIDPCEICRNQAAPIPGALPFDGVSQNCRRCGKFRLTGSILPQIERLSETQRALLSGWVYDQNQFGDVPIITSDDLGRILSRPIPGVLDRANRFLAFSVSQQKKLGERFNMNEPQILAATYSENGSELHALAKFLEAQGLVQFIAMGGLMQVTPLGFIRHEESRGKITGSSQAFVAMWFDETMRTAYANGFEIGIRSAGYEPVRIDGVEHIGKIDDEIIAQIRKSRFVVADFTGHRGGVYFEAGYALGHALPVIWTCRRDALVELHFDTRQFNFIVWESDADLAQRLARRIEAVIGLGPGQN